MASNADFKDRQFLADSVTGLLLAGIGHITAGADAQKNFLVVDSKTETAAIESAFESFTERKDIGIVLINQHVADRIRHRVDTYTAAFPTVLEIPSKDHPYDPEKDSVLRREQQERRNDVPMNRIGISPKEYSNLAQKKPTQP
ncbi:hypothetical protein Trihar35433_358 [Trichoderma harzianum]|nr:hypothetical protein Trihar35433_358 [Trichoderma harzianum]